MMYRRKAKIMRLFRCYWRIFLLVLSFSSTVAGSTSSLMNRWDLPDDPHSFQFLNEAETTGFTFKFEYPVSRDVATESNIAISIYDQGCKYNDGKPSVELVDGTSEELVFPPSLSTSNEPTVMTGLEVTLGGSDSGMNVVGLLQEYPSLWDEEQNQVSFCVRFSLVTENIEVNFVETVVILDVILDGLDFRVQKANIQPKERIESIQQVTYNVKAYLCDGRYRPLKEETTGAIDLLYEVCDPDTGEMQMISRTQDIDPTVTEIGQVYEQELSEAQKVEQEKVIYRQGSVVRVCIRPDDTALGEVSMRTIQEMVFEGTVDPYIAKNMRSNPPTTFLDGEKGIYTQVAVQKGTTKPSSGLSVMSCETNRMEGRPEVVVCAVDTLLVADFYWRPHGNVAVVKAYGNAVLKFGVSNEDVTQKIGKRLRRAEAVAEKLPLHEIQRSLQGVSLDTFWNMTRPKVDFPSIGEATGGFNFRMNYTLSDGISSDMTRLEIWEKSCQKNDGKKPLLEYSFDKESSSNLLEMTSTEANETGVGLGSQIITINGRWKREEWNFSSTLVESPYYAVNSDETLVQISLCARYQLHTKPILGSTEVNFLENPIIINIDMTAEIEFGVSFELIPDEDPCLDELENELRKLSYGRGGVDDLFMSDVYWPPSTQSADPTMSMGPSTIGSSSNIGGGSNWMSPAHQSNSKQGRSSANTSMNSLMITTAIGVFTFLLLSYI